MRKLYLDRMEDDADERREQRENLMLQIQKNKIQKENAMAIILEDGTVQEAQAPKESLVKYPALGYYSGINEIPEGNKKISPSGLSGFFNDSAEWYRKNVEKSEIFDGNTSTVLGTIVHHCAECFEACVAVNEMKIDEYINKFIDNDAVDIAVVESEWRGMFESLKTEYLENPTTPRPIELEAFIHYPLVPGFTVGGSIDRLEPRTIVDYKTAGKKPSNMKTYRLQLLVYAWLYNKIGVPIDTIKVVVVQRKTIKLPPRTWVMEQIITEADMMYIEKMMTTLVSCMKIVEDNFMMRDIIFRENPVSMFAKTEKVLVKRANETQSFGM